MAGLVLYECAGGVATLTLNRPDKRNALNLALWGELEAHLSTIEASGDAIGVVVLRAAGAVFCAGNDLKERGAVAPRANYQAGVVTRLANLPQPYGRFQQHRGLIAVRFAPAHPRQNISQ